MNRTLLIGGVLALLLAASGVQAEPARGSILAIDLGVPVNPLAVHFVESALKSAQHDGTRCIVLNVSVNSGYSSSVSALVRAIQSSSVPVLVRSTSPNRGPLAYLSRAAATGPLPAESASLTAYLASIDGQVVRFHDRAARLKLSGLPVRSLEMSPVARLLAEALTPTLAYLLLVIGLLGIAVEIALPGFGLPGTLGGLSLLISLVALGALSVNLGGLLVILLALLLFVVDLKAPTHGILSAGGIAALVAGSLLLFPARHPLSGVPEMRVAPAAIVVMTVLLAGVLLTAVVLGARAGRQRVQVGPQTYVGLTGVALTDLRPEGIVRVGREEWSARAVDEDIAAGEEVDVVDVQGVHLVIMRRLGCQTTPGVEATMAIGIIWGIVALAAVGLFLSSIKVVREYQRLVVFRLGRSIGARGPGVVFLVPVVDRAVWADLREQYLEIPRQTCITKDNAPIDIDFLIYSRVLDPALSVIQVSNFAGASQGIATTTLRAVIGDIPLDDVLAKREEINRVLRAKLDEVTERWGVKITSVEIREIVPPREIQEAMNRQMSAERNRRAMVTESEGKRQSSILVAEGDKQSAILKAEGERQSTILRAEGYALSLNQIFSAARGIDTKTMSLQYLDALKTIGASPSTKYFFPMELMEFLKPLKSYVERAGQTSESAEPPGADGEPKAPGAGIHVASGGDAASAAG